MSSLAPSNVLASLIDCPELPGLAVGPVGDFGKARLEAPTNVDRKLNLELLVSPQLPQSADQRRLGSVTSHLTLTACTCSCWPKHTEAPWAQRGQAFALCRQLPLKFDKLSRTKSQGSPAAPHRRDQIIDPADGASSPSTSAEVSFLYR